VIGPECGDRAGVVITQLPDVVVPEVVVPPISTSGVEIAGAMVPGVTVAGFTIPEQVVDAGCIIEHAAPGGCLGTIEVTGAAIPDVTIPASIMPEVVLPNGEVLGAQTVAEVVVPGALVAPVRTEQVCQVELDGELPTVSRAGVVRPELTRPGAARPGATRPRRCVDGECVPELRIESVTVEPVEVPDVDVDPGRLESRDLRPDVDVFRGEGEVAFVTPGDVLFDTDSAAIRPEAADALGAVAVEIAAIAPPGSAIRVEGHTDDRADEAHNLELSLRRAQAVADWLVANGDLDRSRLVVVGLGESSPAFPNDSDGNRARNRRVVVTIDDP
jgi:outer membrane protein OmpA-like peptidoglycan-associated protein